MRGSLLIAVLFLSACGIANYKAPPPGQPVADLQMSSTGHGYEVFHLFDHATCANPGTTMAWFNGGSKTTTVKLATNARQYIVSGRAIQTGIRSGIGGSEYLSESCNYMVSFVPLAGHVYSYRHSASRDVGCRVYVLDLSTGQQPAGFQEHSPKDCTRLVW